MSDSCIHCWCPDDVKRLTSKTGKNKTEIVLLRYYATSERSELCAKMLKKFVYIPAKQFRSPLNLTKFLTKNSWNFAYTPAKYCKSPFNFTIFFDEKIIKICILVIRWLCFPDANNSQLFASGDKWIKSQLCSCPKLDFLYSRQEVNFRPWGRKALSDFDV